MNDGWMGWGWNVRINAEREERGGLKEEILGGTAKIKGHLRGHMGT